VLWPFGLEDKNDKGLDLLSTYYTSKLHASNSFFKHANHITHILNNDEKTESMLDLFAMLQSTHKWVRDCVIVNDEIDSDHSAVKLKLLLTSIEFKNNAVIKGIID